MQRSSSLAASLPSIIGTPPRPTRRSGLPATYSAMPSLTPASPARKSRAARCSSTAAAAADHLNVDAHGVEIGKPLVVALAGRRDIGLPAWRSAPWSRRRSNARAGWSRMSRCGLAISAARATPTCACRSMVVLFGRTARAGFAVLARRGRGVFVPLLCHEPVVILKNFPLSSRPSAQHEGRDPYTPAQVA